ncbi:MAG: hypothetical protein ACLS8R_00135 [Anaeromassilibacillus sp.]
MNIIEELDVPTEGKYIQWPDVSEMEDDSLAEIRTRPLGLSSSSTTCSPSRTSWKMELP